MGQVVALRPQQTGYRLKDFDTLECPDCDAPSPPSSLSAGPTVAYRCGCGRSWRINQHGEETHVRRHERRA